MPAYVYRDEGESKEFSTPALSPLDEPGTSLLGSVFDPLIQRLLDDLNTRTQWTWLRSSGFDVMMTLTVNGIDIVYVHRTRVSYLNRSFDSYVMEVIDDACRYVGQILILRK